MNEEINEGMNDEQTITYTRSAWTVILVAEVVNANRHVPIKTSRSPVSDGELLQVSE